MSGTFNGYSKVCDYVVANNPRPPKTPSKRASTQALCLGFFWRHALPLSAMTCG